MTIWLADGFVVAFGGDAILTSNPSAKAQKPSNVPIHRGFALVVANMVGEISVSQELKNP
jgi:hypothetical protein